MHDDTDQDDTQLIECVEDQEATRVIKSVQVVHRPLAVRIFNYWKDKKARLRWQSREPGHATH